MRAIKRQLSWLCLHYELTPNISFFPSCEPGEDVDFKLLSPEEGLLGGSRATLVMRRSAEFWSADERGSSPTRRPSRLTRMRGRRSGGGESASMASAACGRLPPVADVSRVTMPTGSEGGSRLRGKPSRRERRIGAHVPWRAQGVSKNTIHRAWQDHGLKPHLTKSFKLSRAPRFLENSIRRLSVEGPFAASVTSGTGSPSFSPPGMLILSPSFGRPALNESSKRLPALAAGSSSSIPVTPGSNHGVSLSPPYDELIKGQYTRKNRSSSNLRSG